jgi:hypothetical protein
MSKRLTTKFHFLTIVVMFMTAISIGSLALYREVTTNRASLHQFVSITAGILA